MASKPVKHLIRRAPRQPVRARRHLRVLSAVAAVFVAGVGVGALIAGWVATEEPRGIHVALERGRPALEVPVRAYRPPVRDAQRARPQPTADPETSELAALPDPVPLTHEHGDEHRHVNERANEEQSPPVVPPPASVETPSESEPAPPTRITSSKTATWLANAVGVAPAEGRPMIAIVIDDLGIDQRRTKRAIALPAPLTLAFIPYGYNLRDLAKSSHDAGHELLVHVNMEPTDRGVDPGPKALLTSLPLAEIRRRMDWALGQFDGFVGINNHMGSRFTEWPDGMEVVLQTLRGRGLLFLDSLTSTKSVGAALARAHGMPYAARDIFLDHDRTLEFVAAQLKQTERIARRNGHAIAIGHPHDVTVEVLTDWIPKAQAAGFQLVPLSAIVRKRRGEG